MVTDIVCCSPDIHFHLILTKGTLISFNIAVFSDNYLIFQSLCKGGCAAQY